MSPRQPVQSDYRPRTEGPFNVELFYQALDSKRRERRASWRQVCREAGIHGPSTLSRLSLDSKLPHLQSVCRLLLWMGETDVGPYLTPGEHHVDG